MKFCRLFFVQLFGLFSTSKLPGKIIEPRDHENTPTTATPQQIYHSVDDSESSGVFESPHPYENNQNYEWSLPVREGKFVKVYFEALSIEMFYDNLYIKSDDKGGLAWAKKQSKYQVIEIFGILSSAQLISII